MAARARDALTLLGSARHGSEAAAIHDKALGALATRLTEATYLISDVAADLASYADSIEADPGRLAVVQDRRAELTRLIRVYGSAPVPQASRRDAASNSTTTDTTRGMNAVPASDPAPGSKRAGRSGRGDRPPPGAGRGRTLARG